MTDNDLEQAEKTENTEQETESEEEEVYDPNQNVKDSMDNMYRWTRHVYDASRKYYLLGRDKLIKDLDPNPNDIIVEAGCGTARNLVKMAKTHPTCHFFGFDASDEMLKTAFQSLDKENMVEDVPIAQGYAQNFDPKYTFGLEQQPNTYVFSYALSMIPPWKESVDHTLKLLNEGGEIHVVDFGDQAGLPEWFRKFLYWWLDKFGVHFRPELLEYFKELEAAGKVDLKIEHLYKGYSYYAVLTKRPEEE